MADLEQKIQQMQQRLNDLQSKAKKQQQRDQTRRKILYGAAILALLEGLEEAKRESFLAKLHRKITRPSDRRFLALPVETEDPKSVPRYPGRGH